MKHSRKGVKCSGCWKAYSDPEKARKAFLTFRKCTETFHEMKKNGKSLAQLAVIGGYMIDASVLLKNKSDKHLNVFWQYDGKPWLENIIAKALITTTRTSVNLIYESAAVRELLWN